MTLHLSRVLKFLLCIPGFNIDMNECIAYVDSMIECLMVVIWHSLVTHCAFGYQTGGRGRWQP